MRIDQIMTRDVRACRADDPMSVATQIMWERDCGCVPVVDADGRAIAMITDRDIAIAAYTQDRRLSEMPVSVAMSRQLFTVDPIDTIADAERLMREHQVRRLPVVEATGRLVGIVSLNDITRVQTRGVAHKAKEAVVGDVLHTLAAIGETRGGPQRTASAAE